MKEIDIEEKMMPVQSIGRIFDLIELLTEHPSGAPLQLLSNQTGLAKSTTHRLLKSLISRGYVIQDSFTSHYRLTLKLFETASSIINNMDLFSIAKPHLDLLAARSGEAVHLVIRDYNDIVYIYKAESATTRMMSQLGNRAPLYCTAVGKAILSTLTIPEVQLIWKDSNVKKITQTTITDWGIFLSQIEQAKIDGFAIDNEENELGIRCVGFPLPGIDGQANSAFSISGLINRMTDEKIEDIKKLAKEMQKSILHNLGLIYGPAKEKI